MNKIISCKSNPDHYSDAPVVVWCFDDRFSGLWDMFVKHMNDSGHKFKDSIKIAGGAKDLSSPDAEYKKERILWDIEASIKLHNPPFIVLMTHKDCGAYGKSFSSDEEEIDFHISELKKAEVTVFKHLSGNGKDKCDLEILKYYADFEGLHEVS